MKNILFLVLLAFLATPAYAHEGHVHVVPEAQAQVTPTPIATPLPSVDDQFSEEGLSDLDVEADAEAETIPADGIFFGLENAWYRIKRAFTFQAERKAELDRQRLHRLDRKMTACAELGDEACVDRIESMISKTEERAKAFIERKTEIKDRFEGKFELWRLRRGERVKELRGIAEERKADKDELLQERKEKLDEIRKRREEFNEYREERLKEIRSSRPATREDVRERVIEQRSDRVKQELDATRSRVDERNINTQNVLDAIE